MGLIWHLCYQILNFDIICVWQAVIKKYRGGKNTEATRSRQKEEGAVGDKNVEVKRISQKKGGGGLGQLGSWANYGR